MPSFGHAIAIGLSHPRIYTARLLFEAEKLMVIIFVFVLMLDERLESWDSEMRFFFLYCLF